MGIWDIGETWQNIAKYRRYILYVCIRLDSLGFTPDDDVERDRLYKRSYDINLREHKRNTLFLGYTAYFTSGILVNGIFLRNFFTDYAPLI